MSHLDDENVRPDYDEPGPERRRGDRRMNTLDLVEQAATRAARKVAAVHSRRLALWCFLGALVASCAIALPVVLALDQARRSDSVANARFNCTQWNEGAAVMEKFVQGQVDLQANQARLVAQRQDVLRGLSKIFGQGTYQELQKQSAKLNADNLAFVQTRLLPRLRALATVNCDRTITSAGVKTTATVGSITVTVPGG